MMRVSMDRIASRISTLIVVSLSATYPRYIYIRALETEFVYSYRVLHVCAPSVLFGMLCISRLALHDIQLCGHTGPD